MDVITNSSGVVTQTMFFDAWGARRSVDWLVMPGTISTAFNVSVTTRGFTGHEMLDSVGIIHMNGRIYDAKLARFLQADPLVQDPTNGQSLNRYSYVWNNPLNATDPSGYFAKDLLGAVIGAALFAIGGPIASNFWLNSWYATAALGGITGGITALINGGNVLQGVLIGAASAAAFHGVGTAFENIAASNLGCTIETAGRLTSGQFAAKIAAHALVGGTMSSLQGGKFGHGFVATGATQSLAPQIGGIDSATVGFSGKRVIVAAMVGGTVSTMFVQGFKRYPEDLARVACHYEALEGEHGAHAKLYALSADMAIGAAMRSFVENPTLDTAGIAVEVYGAVREVVKRNFDRSFFLGRLVSGGAPSAYLAFRAKLPPVTTTPLGIANFSVAGYGRVLNIYDSGARSPIELVAAGTAHLPSN